MSWLCFEEQVGSRSRRLVAVGFLFEEQVVSHDEDDEDDEEDEEDDEEDEDDETFGHQHFQEEQVVSRIVSSLFEAKKGVVSTRPSHERKRGSAP